MKRRATFHLILWLLIAAAIPVFAGWMNGGLRVELVMLGLVLGFAYWYRGPLNVGL